MYSSYKSDLENSAWKISSWYLHESIIPFCLADPKVSDLENTAVADRLLDLDQEATIPILYEKAKIGGLLEGETRPCLSSFVKPGSKLVFDILKMDDERLELLKLPPSTRSLLTPYKQFCKFVSSLPVVNDAGERTVKLIQDFINSSTDENLRKDMILAIEMKRKGHPIKQSQIKN